MGWLKNRFETLVDALTLKRVIALPLIIAVITALVRLAPVIGRAEGAPLFLAVPAWTWGLTGGLILIVFFLLDYVTRNRLDLQPRVAVVCPVSGLGIIAAIAREPIPSNGRIDYGPPFKARYVHIQIDNLRNDT